MKLSDIQFAWQAQRKCDAAAQLLIALKSTLEDGGLDSGELGEFEDAVAIAEALLNECNGLDVSAVRDYSTELRTRLKEMRGMA